MLLTLTWRILTLTLRRSLPCEQSADLITVSDSANIYIYSIHVQYQRVAFYDPFKTYFYMFLQSYTTLTHFLTGNKDL